jgi:hypothetical protein
MGEQRAEIKNAKQLQATTMTHDAQQDAVELTTGWP